MVFVVFSVCPIGLIHVARSFVTFYMNYSLRFRLTLYRLRVVHDPPSDDEGEAVT